MSEFMLALWFGSGVYIWSKCPDCLQVMMLSYMHHEAVLEHADWIIFGWVDAFQESIHLLIGSIAAGAKPLLVLNSSTFSNTYVVDRGPSISTLSFCGRSPILQHCKFYFMFTVEFE